MNNTTVSVQMKDGSARRIPRNRAEELVENGKASFISKTKFKAITAGVKVSDKLYKQGDRAVKDFLSEKLETKKKSEKAKAKTNKKDSKKDKKQKGA